MDLTKLQELESRFKKASDNFIKTHDVSQPIPVEIEEGLFETLNAVRRLEDALDKLSNQLENGSKSS